MKRPRAHPALLAALFAVTFLVPSVFAQTTLTATLSGTAERPGPGDPNGTGYAVLDLDPVAGTVRYTIFTDDILAPSAAHIHRGTSEVAGGVVVNLAPEFQQGPGEAGYRASGTVQATSTLIEEILADPAAFYVNVHNSEYEGGAVRGQLTRNAAGATQRSFPVAGAAAGANNTFFRTIVTLLNDSGNDTVVTLEYYPSGPQTTGAPTATAIVPLEAGEQVSGDVVNIFGFEGDSTGAIRVLAPASIVAVSRIFNDQRPIDGGTYGQFVPALTMEQAGNEGSLPMLENTHPATGIGFRSNVGWFNPGDQTVNVVFRAHRSNGTVLEGTTRTIRPREQQQLQLNDLFPSLEPLDAMYVTFSAAESPVHIYASVVDNRTGDAVFIPAQ